MAVHVKGLRETERAFRQLDKGLAKEMRDALKKAGEPVAQTAKQKIGRYQGSSTGTIRPRVARGASVFVRQNARKVSGKRGDFGLLQQRRLEEALQEREPDVVRELERALDRMTDDAGF